MKELNINLLHLYILIYKNYIIVIYLQKNFILIIKKVLGNINIIFILFKWAKNWKGFLIDCFFQILMKFNIIIMGIKQMNYII